MSNTNLSFEIVNDALQKIDSLSEVSEAHGSLCGLICISGKSDIKPWLNLLFEDQESRNLNVGASEEILSDLYNDTFEKLSNGQYNLEILIHSDDDPLEIRVDDLCLWCQGFLYGLSLAGLTDISKLPEETSEFLQDMTDISKAGYAPEDNDEENEAAFAEILEYIRAGTYVVYNTFNMDAHENNSKTLH